MGNDFLNVFNLFVLIISDFGHARPGLFPFEQFTKIFRPIRDEEDNLDKVVELTPRWKGYDVLINTAQTNKPKTEAVLTSYFSFESPMRSEDDCIKPTCDQVRACEDAGNCGRIAPQKAESRAFTRRTTEDAHTDSKQ